MPTSSASTTDSTPPALTLDERIDAWERAFEAVRAYLRGQGLREVSTPVHIPAVAVEPYIEPLRVTGGAAEAVFATSPELPMKQLLMHGSGPIFQVAHVARASERGDQHAEEFHLVEWYRPGATELRTLAADVEGLVAAVFDAVGRRQAPTDWGEHAFIELVEQTCGVRLRGDEDAEALGRAVGGPRPDLKPGLHTLARPLTGEVAALAAWTEFFSLWSDRALQPWLDARQGVHIVEFPPALAALSSVGRARLTPQRDPPCALAMRIESHVRGLELANGYCELRDPDEQQARFCTVQGLRAALGQPPLPEPRDFVAAMRTDPLPPTVGCALGLDRLLALACGAARIGDVALPLPWSGTAGPAPGSGAPSV